MRKSTVESHELRRGQSGNRRGDQAFATITDAELDAAIAAADEAHRTWSKSTTVEERAALVRRVGELHVERRQELAEIILRKMGKPITQAGGDVDYNSGQSCNAAKRFIVRFRSTKSAGSSVVGNARALGVLRL